MGRPLRAARIVRTMRRRLDIPIVKRRPDAAPPWLAVVEAIPPAEILTRPIPMQHRLPNPKMTKPRKVYLPQEITYEEDELRRRFFRDHPWELARPRVIVEFDGKDARYYDWSRGLRQPGIPLTGECVVQRQLWMMHNEPGITRDQAYDRVRKEFYRLRQEEEVERRIAQEEARMVGAYFGKTRIQIGMQLEDEQFEKWKAWAADQTARIEAERSQAYTSHGQTDDAEGPIPELDGQEAASA